jgi:hypothetical protein
MDAGEEESHMGVKVRRVALATLATASVVLGGCTVPADTVHVAYGAVTNQCDAPIRAVVTQFSTDISAGSSPATLKLVNPGERVEMYNPMYRPLQENVYLWVARDGAAKLGEPLAIPSDTTASSVETNDGDVIDVVVTGSMCP